ncbi:MAG: ATP-binding protein, partial [Solirubrobacteraceae bacterium]
HRPPLLEREESIERLSELVHRTAGGQGSIVSILGRPGEGKTTLLAAACVLAEERGLRVCRARGSELERDFAFGVVRQLLEPDIRALDLQQQNELFEGSAGLARSVFGLQSDRLADGPFAVLHGLYWVLEGFAARGPVLLAIDDLHWADETSLQLVAYLRSRIEDLPVLVILATRPHMPDHDLLAALTADPDISTLRVKPLTQESVAILVEHAFNTPVDPIFTAACQQVSAGNPFAISELLAELRRRGSNPDRATAAVLEDLASVEIERNVASRLGRLDAESLSVIHTLAVLDDGAPLRHVGVLSGLDLDRAAHAIDTLIAAGLLNPTSELRFVHPLLRTAVYESIGARRRARLHTAAANLLAQESAEPETIAAHLLQSDPAADPVNVEQLRTAAHVALRRAAPSVAVTYLRRALAEPPSKDDRMTVLAELGRAEWMTGDPSAIEHLQASWEHSNDPMQRAQLAGELAGALALTGQWDAPI